MLRLHPSALDYSILAIYFVAVLGIGFIARLSIKTDIDFFLSGRSLPAWITGLAFIAADLGALEILGQSANGAQYGVASVHFGSPLSASFWQAIIAFIADAVVLVAVSLVTRPKPQEELRGLFWGLTRTEEREENYDPRDRLWWRSPALLGGVSIAILVVPNIIFI
jgi:Na+/proline symporter